VGTERRDDRGVKEQLTSMEDDAWEAIRYTAAAMYRYGVNIDSNHKVNSDFMN